MEELLLPIAMRAKASVTVGGEYAWRQENILQAIYAAGVAGLAVVGGQPQFQFPDGTCELYWLSYQASAQQTGEAWPSYVQRSASEVDQQFDRICATTDFTAEALDWQFIRQKVEADRMNPLDYLWFMLYFAAEE